MKILQLPSWYLPEGGQFCLHQSIALQEQGLDVHILANVVLPWRKYKGTILNYPFKAFTSTENGILTYRYYSWKYPFVDIPNIIKWTKKTVKLFEQYSKTYGFPDIIHVHSSMWGGYAASIIKKKYNIPYVITEHRGIFGMATTYARKKFKPRYEAFLTDAFSNANYIVPVSSQQINQIKTFCQNKTVPIKTIPNILNTDYFHPIERKRKKNNPFIFISVNGFNPFKGYEFLLPAFDMVCETNSNVHLRIVGEDFDKKEFQLLLQKSNNKEKISFAGEVTKEKVRKELWNADAFVIASRTEAQSVATVEAMSTGLPVVGTTVTPKEILTERCGYLVPVENSKELAIAMEKMILNHKNFDGNYISAHTKKLVSKDVVVNQIISVYNKILT